MRNLPDCAVESALRSLRESGLLHGRLHRRILDTIVNVALKAPSHASLDYVVWFGERIPECEEALVHDGSLWGILRYAEERLKVRWPVGHLRQIAESKIKARILETLTSQQWATWGRYTQLARPEDSDFGEIPDALLPHEHVVALTEEILPTLFEIGGRWSLRSDFLSRNLGIFEASSRTFYRLEIRRVYEDPKLSTKSKMWQMLSTQGGRTDLTCYLNRGYFPGNVTDKKINPSFEWSRFAPHPIPVTTGP